MNAWIDVMAEMTGIGRMGMDFSLSDLSTLAPDTAWLVVTAVVVAFCLVGACQDAWLDRREDRNSHSKRQ